MNAPLTSGPRPAGEMSASDSVKAGRGRQRRSGAAERMADEMARRDRLFRERRGCTAAVSGERRFAGERRSAVAGGIESKCLNTLAGRRPTKGRQPLRSAPKP